MKPWVSLPSRAILDRARDLDRVSENVRAELAKVQLCNETNSGGVCQLDRGHAGKHRARVGERIELAGGGVRRNVIEWGVP